MAIRYTSAKTRRQFTFDSLLLMKDAGALTTSGAGTVGGTAKVLDVGTGYVEGDLVVDVTAIENGSNQSYNIQLQGSTDPAFGTGIVTLASETIGAANVSGNTVAHAAGRYIIGVNSEQNGTYYRYLRLYVTISGTVTTGVNFTAFLANDIL